MTTPSRISEQLQHIFAPFVQLVARPELTPAAV